MLTRSRNNVRVAGDGAITMVFAHGFGCDQTMWNRLAPMYAGRFRTLTFDLVGSGGSDLAAYDRAKYGTLHGYAGDLIEILREHVSGKAVFVGHSVSAMIGMLAAIEAPGLFATQVMVCPSPCYIDDDGYLGGFSRGDIDELLDTMDANYLGWSSSLAPAIMGAPDRPELGLELTDSFCRNDPDVARHFARTTFLSDHRPDVPHSRVPALILQCSDDMVAPRQVGDYLHRHLPHSSLSVIENIGHCPHVSAPAASARAIDAFLARTLG